jgi:hypothetical protein
MRRNRLGKVACPEKNQPAVFGSVGSTCIQQLVQAQFGDHVDLFANRSRIRSGFDTTDGMVLLPRLTSSVLATAAGFS